MKTNRKGYTMIELLIVVVIMGVLATVITSGFANVVPAGRETVALSKARVLNGARNSYAIMVPGAATNWAAATTDTAKVELLIGANLLTGSSGNYLASAGGYTLSLAGGLRAATIVSYAGTTLVYE